MSDMIRDPLDSTKAIHVPSGRMAASFFAAPVGTPLEEMEAVKYHVGFADPDEINRSMYQGDHQ